MEKLELQGMAVSQTIVVLTESRRVTVPRTILEIIVKGRFPQVTIREMDGLPVMGPPVIIIGSTPTENVRDVHLGTLVVGEKIVIAISPRPITDEPMHDQMKLLSSDIIAVINP